MRNHLMKYCKNCDENILFDFVKIKNHYKQIKLVRKVDMNFWKLYQQY
jgi:hypothetical protein